MDGEPDAAESPREPAQAVAGEPPAIDIAALAERVYRLMCRELRLERARGASLFGTRT